jgi:cytochrome P450
MLMRTPPPNPSYELLCKDPYPVLRGIRDYDPLWYCPDWQVWFVTGYDAVAATLRTPGLSATFRVQGLPYRLVGPAVSCISAVYRIVDALSEMMLFADPPKHTRLRALVNKAFTPRSVEQMAVAVRQRVEKLFANFQDGQVIEVMDRIANPLPVQTMIDFLGSRQHDETMLSGCSHDLATLLGEYGTIDPAMIDAADQSILKMRAYFGEVIKERRARPGADLISRLIAARAEEQALTDDEITLMCMVMFGAGQDTTANHIGNGILALMEYPQECQRLVREPSLLPRAVEEVLRYDGPLQMITRYALENVEIGDKAIPRGATLYVCLAGANRDPLRYPEPNRFSLTRPDDFPHMGFGWGIHFCVGAFLAKIQVRTVYQLLLERYPRSRLAGVPERCPSMAFRRLDRLPIELRT